MECADCLHVLCTQSWVLGLVWFVITVYYMYGFAWMSLSTWQAKWARARLHWHLKSPCTVKTNVQITMLQLLLQSVPSLWMQKVGSNNAKYAYMHACTQILRMYCKICVHPCTQILWYNILPMLEASLRAEGGGTFWPSFSPNTKCWKNMYRDMKTYLHQKHSTN